MAKTRPGLERLVKQELQGKAVRGERDLKAHIKVCYTCVQAGDDLYARCSVWWQAALKAHRARRRYDNFMRVAEQPQLDLGLGDQE